MPCREHLSVISTWLFFSFDFKCWVILLFCIVLDPPSPDGSPNITSVSHNSVKVKFSGFKASNGPIKAYAIILTTGEGKEGLQHGLTRVT